MENSEPNIHPSFKGLVMSLSYLMARSKDALGDGADKGPESKNRCTSMVEIATGLEKALPVLMALEKTALERDCALDEAKSKVEILEKKNASFIHELDLANTKSCNAESTVGELSKSISELKDENASYLRQIEDLEKEANKVPALEKSLVELKRQTDCLEARTSEAHESLKAKDTEIANLKQDASDAQKAKILFQDSIDDFWTQFDTGVSVSVLDGSTVNLSGSTAAFSGEEREKAQIEQVKVKSAGASSTDSFGERIAALEKQLDEKNAEVSKLVNDKDKLEAYMKKTMTTFQDKYLIALQDCKAKLKEKHDKIESLESRSANEKVAQKREERLLSSAIFELGQDIIEKNMGKNQFNDATKSGDNTDMITHGNNFKESELSDNASKAKNRFLKCRKRKFHK